MAQYRYGKGNFQVHYALKAPPKWKAPALARVALTHLTPGLDGVSKAANEAERGMLPAVPTICVGQPAALDPSRCPEGESILWLQLPEAPRFIKGDAAGEIAVPADGKWTEAVREKYADRIEAILASHIEDFRDNVIARKAYSPADLEVAQCQSGGRRSLRRLLRHRPVFHLAAVPQFGQSPHAGGAASITSAPRPIRARASAAARVICWRRRWVKGARRSKRRASVIRAWPATELSNFS